ncbi:hypothetical protein [Paraburkholderia caledonica]|jgi:hypothetical protein|uniref:hypothetical protein n=1 Tax=Paraburkholderia caledonica TaxID=134536 RepID=UPI0038BAD519
MTAEEFKELLLQKTVQEIVSDYITIDDPGPFVSQDAIDYVVQQARLRFQIGADQPITPIVVGSAKLGFSIVEKLKPDYKPRYRLYREGVSDIDLALVSPSLYGKVWSDIALYGANRDRFPWRSGDLADYMLHGWIRPDKLPKPATSRCQDFFDLVTTLNGSTFFRFKKLRCALYHSRYFLNLYQQRSVNSAKLAAQMDEL